MFEMILYHRKSHRVALILQKKYLERKSERPGNIFPIQMEREKIGYFPFTSERGKQESLSENFGKNNALPGPGTICESLLKSKII